MHCPKCQHTQKYASGMKCVGCGYQYIFNPKESHGLSDKKLHAAIDRASGNGIRHFCSEHIFTLLAQKASRPPSGPKILFWISVITNAIAVFSGQFWLLGPGVIGVLGSFFWRKKSRKIPTNSANAIATFLRALKEEENTKLLLHPETPLLKEAPSEEWSEPDLYDYGIERVLIVEHDILVDLLVKNDFHAEQRTLVLSEKGYPNYLLPIAEKALAEREDLPVFLLHDATPAGMELEGRIRQSGLLSLGEREVIDLGLCPEDAREMQILRNTGIHERDFQAPVLYLPYPMISAILAGCFSHQASLSALRAQGEMDDGMMDGGMMIGGGGGDFG